MKKILLNIFLIVLVYIYFCFIAFDINCFNWSQELRATIVFIYFIFTIIYFLIYFTSEDNKENSH